MRAILPAMRGLASIVRKSSMVGACSMRGMVTDRSETRMIGSSSPGDTEPAEVPDADPCGFAALDQAVVGAPTTAWSRAANPQGSASGTSRSEEHTSELQSPCNLVCRLLLEKKKTR